MTGYARFKKMKNNSSSEKHYAEETLAAQALGTVDAETGSIVPPIHLSTTYQRDLDYEKTAGRSYIRDQGPSQQHVEALITELEGGEAAMSFGSGIAASA